MSNQLALFESQVDFSSTKIIKLPERIWVFGGQISDIKDPEPISFRDKYLRHAFSSRASFAPNLAKPEDYPDWWNFAGYPDLLEFESDAGCLAQLIVIFLESPGAWVELGAFANDVDLCKKLLVVMSERFRNSTSFIELGPLRRISKHHPDDDAVCVLPSESYEKLDQTELEIITKSIHARLAKAHKSESWDANKRAHRLLLAADLADLYQSIRTSTLIEIAQKFAYNPTPSELNRQAKLLDMLGLANLKELGTEKILCTPGRHAHPLLNYQGLPGKRFDRARFKTDSAILAQEDAMLKKALEGSK
ncbi:MAG: hypothetical protein HYX45_13710 [Burkholderiales bacterium]|nr:hypothetical protein [Burkholderiales bacterium]